MEVNRHIGSGLALGVLAALLAACGGSPDCAPHESTYCSDGVTYWVDGCGHLEKARESCECGCNNDFTGCRSCGCTPRCAGKCCGDDGCGGTCPDTCAATGQVCDLDSCSCTGGCVPQDCAQQGRECGSWSDGCGAMLDCGSCPAGQACDAQGRCQQSCPGGTTLCGDRCVDTERDPRHCGGCDRACDPGQICEASACVAGPDCREQACTGFTYCDLNTGECLPGCITDDQCLQDEHCQLDIHDCACNDGTHRCAGMCVDDDSPLHCGTRCDPCPGDPHGSATCTGGSCGLDCDPGYLFCGGVCLGCADPHGSASCGADGTCHITCDAGYHLCGGSCASDTSPGTCGTSCTPCPEPDHARATCENGTCEFVCDTGFHRCQDACYADDDPDHCGPGCIDCPAPESGTALCIDGACASDCPAGLTLCGSICVDTETDDDHCGGCDAPCATGSSCEGGICRCLTSWSLGPFTSLETSGTIWWADLGDVDADGHQDIVMACNQSSYSEYGEIRVRLGNGDGSFAPSLVTELPNEHRVLRSVTLGRFDDDSLLDAAIVFHDYVTYETWYTSAGIWNGAGDGTFTAGGHWSLSYSPEAGWPMFIQASDLDGNGVDDLVVIAGNGGNYEGVIRNFRQDPAGTFGGEYFESVDGLHFASIGDWNQDDIRDLVVTRPWGDCKVMRGNSYFGYDQLEPLPCYEAAAATGDLDGTGGDEVALARFDYEGEVYHTEVSVYRYDGSVLSPIHVVLLEGTEAYAAVIDDLDADGDGDVIVAHIDADANLSIQPLMGGGDGTLCIHEARTMSNPDTTFVRLLPRDLNSDGCTDLLLVASDLYFAEGMCTP